MSNNAKWVIAAICAVLGVIALIYAVIYLAVPIHSLPGFVPGKKAVNGPLPQAGLHLGGHRHRALGHRRLSRDDGPALDARLPVEWRHLRRSGAAGRAAGGSPASS